MCLVLGTNLNENLHQAPGITVPQYKSHIVSLSCCMRYFRDVYDGDATNHVKTQKYIRLHDAYQVPGTWYDTLFLRYYRVDFTPIQTSLLLVAERYVISAAITCVTGGRVSREHVKYTLPEFGHHAMRVLFRFDVMQQYTGEDITAAISCLVVQQ